MKVILWTVLKKKIKNKKKIVTGKFQETRF